jgi:hypothetical protein
MGALSLMGGGRLCLTDDETALIDEGVLRHLQVSGGRACTQTRDTKHTAHE